MADAFFALIGRGGSAPGARPATRLAWIEGQKMQTWNGRAWITSGKKTAEVRIYTRWGLQHPTDAEVRWAKKRLTPQ